MTMTFSKRDIFIALIVVFSVVSISSNRLQKAYAKEFFQQLISRTGSACEVILDEISS